MTTKCALCAIARDETPYLAEWAAFHLAIGFERVVVYNNDLEDTRLDVLDRAAFAGKVVVERWRSEAGLPPQVPAYDDFLARTGADFDWIMFLDIDEFLNLKVHDTVGAFVDDFDRVDAIAVNWRIFGSAGHRTSSPDLVLQRFDRAAPPSFGPNTLVKTIFRPRAAHGAAIHSPHLRPEAVMVNPNRGRVAQDANAVQETVDYSVAQINHYFTKSLEEFAAKRKRGRGDLEDGNAEKYRSEQTFDAYDRNEVEDGSIKRFIPALRALLA